MMTTVPFTVPVLATTPVSGGGAALQAAITAAAPGDRLLIQDSLAYSPVTVSMKTNLTIDVLPGQTPSITAVPGPDSRCIRLAAGNSGLAIKNMTFIGSGNGGSADQTQDGLINGSASGTGLMPSIDRLIIEDCTFSEPVATVASGAPGIQLVGTDGSVHQNVWVHRCTFRNNAAGPGAQARGYGACTIGGFDHVFIQNSQIVRDSAVIARASSNMRGFTWVSKNVVIEDCLVNDIGTAGSNEAFKAHDEVVFGTALGPATLRNCVTRNCKRGYRCDGAAPTSITATNSVYFCDTLGILAGQTAVRQSAGLMVFRNGIIQGAGDGTAFEAAVTEDHNDVFNVGAPGKVLDPTDLTIDPVLEDPLNHLFNATAPAVTTGASDGMPMGIRYVANSELIIWCGVP